MGDQLNGPIYVGNLDQSPDTNLGLGRGRYVDDRGIAPNTRALDVPTSFEALDLVNGAQAKNWRDFENDFNLMSGTTNKQIMAKDAQQYNLMLNVFADKQRIDLSRVDVIVGPNYHRAGGNLICLRSQAMKSYAGSAKGSVSLPDPSIPDAKQTKVGAGITVGAMVLNYWYTGIVKFWQDERAKAQAELDRKAIFNAQSKDPFTGALVRFAFMKVEANDDLGFVNKKLVISPQDVFQYSDIHYDTLRDRALRTIQREPEHREMFSSGAGTTKDTWRYEIVWIEPLRPPMLSPVGWWLVQVDRWTWYYEFQPDGKVRWVDPNGGDNGNGKWSAIGDLLKITWASRSYDEWEYPLRSIDQPGRSSPDYASAVEILRRL